MRRDHPKSVPHCELYERSDDHLAYLCIPLEEYDRVSSFIGNKCGPVAIPLLGGGEITLLAENIRSVIQLTAEAIEFNRVCDEADKQDSLRGDN